MPTTVTWEGIVNARDLAGLPTPSGPVRPSRLIRSGNLSRLTEQGKAEVRGAGVSRIVDVRCAEERSIDPAPFLGEAMYLNVLALPHGNFKLNEASAAAQTNADHYRAMLKHAAPNLTLILQQIVDAPPGAVLVHCHIGKDRTGLVTALALFVAGVPDAEIAADYAQTDQHVQPLYAASLARQTDPAKRAELARFLVSHPADMLSAIDFLRELGGLDYLTRRGFGPDLQAALRGRLTRP
ncbi:tyrosine-protein phosphatase [Deinococcus detaillensis]|uniref:tyrosine-protein phosphatase n=1 Tax=Deinococcus detaillensis TaxID=2592048 RepID=UPI00163D9551|nr:tyrosine-protein phosphatase [Deinococcus detaillensis]